MNGTIQIFTTKFPDGTTVPLWLKLFLHGNISSLGEKLENSKKEEQEILEPALTQPAF